MICEGPCNRPYREAWRAYEAALRKWRKVGVWLFADEPEPPNVDPVPGEPTWCPRCTARIRAALYGLDYLAGIAAASADGHRSRPGSDKVSGSRGTPTPSATGDVLDELYGYLTRIEDQWREARGYPPRPPRAIKDEPWRSAPRGARELTVVIAWLGRHLGDILANAGSVGFGRSVLGWHARLQKMTRTEPPLRRRPAACPRCDRRSLALRDDSYTECRSCGRLMNEDEYEELAAAELINREAS